MRTSAREYKETGVSWLGAIPKEWRVAPIRHYARLESGHTPSRQHPEYWIPEECTIPWITLADVWQLRSGTQDYVANTEEKISPVGLANSPARLLPANTVILSRTASVGFAGIMATAMATTQDFANWVCGPRLRPEYLLNVFRAMAPEFKRLTMGSVHQTIYMPAIREMVTPVPPGEEQDRIVLFLRSRLPAIDALIAKKERLIELLQEKRQALITQAVTKGLDPSVRMKESGIEWMDQIPEHWQMLPLKRLARKGGKTFTDGDWIEAPYVTDSGVRLIQTGNVGTGFYKEQGFRFVSEDTFRKLRCTLVEPSDVLVCRLDGPVGRACLAPDLGRMITSVDNAILKPRADVDPRFVVYALSLPAYLDWVQGLCRVGGGFRFRISRSMLGDFQLPVPSFAEQVRISDVLDQATATSKLLEARLAGSIALLREYRQALITAAVTGKLEIPEEPAA